MVDQGAFAEHAASNPELRMNVDATTSVRVISPDAAMGTIPDEAGPSRLSRLLRASSSDRRLDRSGCLVGTLPCQQSISGLACCQVAR